MEDVIPSSSHSGVPRSSVKAPPSLYDSPSTSVGRFQGSDGSQPNSVPKDDINVLLLVATFEGRDIFASIMASFQGNTAVAARLFEAVRNDSEMSKAETKIGLARLAQELRVLVSKEKFVGPRNEHLGPISTAQVSRKSNSSSQCSTTPWSNNLGVVADAIHQGHAYTR